MAFRVGQVGARESHVDARARDVQTQITDEERFWRRLPHARRFRLSRFRSAVLVLALIGAWLAPVAAPPAALGAQLVRIFNYTGAMQNWTVPAGVHFAHFDVRGAQGGGNDVFSIFPVIKGGEGGRTVAEIRVFPGEVIHIFVGGKGGNGGPCPHRNPPADHPVGASTAGVTAAIVSRRVWRWGRRRRVGHSRRGHALDQPRHRRRWGRRFVREAEHTVWVLDRWWWWWAQGS